MTYFSQPLDPVQNLFNCCFANGRKVFVEKFHLWSLFIPVHHTSVLFIFSVKGQILAEITSWLILLSVVLTPAPIRAVPHTSAHLLPKPVLGCPPNISGIINDSIPQS